MDLCAGKDGSCGVGGVRGIGDEDDVAGVDECEGEVGETFLGSDEGNDFGLWAEIDFVALMEELGDGGTEGFGAEVVGVAVVLGFGEGSLHVLDDELGRGTVGVANAEIDHVAAGVFGGGSFSIDFYEEVGREVLEALGLGLGHWACFRGSLIVRL